jgi:hypothetical protein
MLTAPPAQSDDPLDRDKLPEEPATDEPLLIATSPLLPASLSDDIRDRDPLDPLSEEPPSSEILPPSEERKLPPLLMATLPPSEPCPPTICAQPPLETLFPELIQILQPVSLPLRPTSIDITPLSISASPVLQSKLPELTPVLEPDDNKIDPVLVSESSEVMLTEPEDSAAPLASRSDPPAPESEDPEPA